MDGKLKFLVVDDHPIFRHGLIALLESDPRYTVRAEAGTIAEALAAVAGDRPDIVILDISLGEESEIGPAEDIVELLPGNKDASDLHP